MKGIKALDDGGLFAAGRFVEAGLFPAGQYVEMCSPEIDRMSRMRVGLEPQEVRKAFP
jgi:hypothetical protein